MSALRDGWLAWWGKCELYKKFNEGNANVTMIASEAFAAGAEWMRGEMLAIAQANEREILASEGEGREWAGVHNLLLCLRNTGEITHASEQHISDGGGQQGN